MSRDDSIDSIKIKAVLHDVRQMLTVISGRVGILRLHSTDAKLQKNLDAMEVAVTDAGEMLGRLQGEPAIGETAIEKFTDIRRVILQSASLIQPVPGIDWAVDSADSKRNLDTTWSLGLVCPNNCLTSVPATILREVLNNLFLNALGVISAGGDVQVELSQIGEEWRLRFQDSGPGIPAQDHKHIFETGYTTSGDSSRGFGLGNCRALLTPYGARMTLVPDQPGGACFELIFPRQTYSRDLLEKVEIELPSFRPKVMVVDDEVTIREMLAEVLLELGCSTEVARDSASAQGIFPSGGFELAMIDQSLPGINGLDLASSIRQQDKSVILVLMSGWGPAIGPGLVGGSVVDFFIEKPITLGDLETLLNQAGELFRQRCQGY